MIAELYPGKIQELQEKANTIRRLIIEMLVEAKSGHSAGPLGLSDIFAAFYFYILNHDPKNPDWEDRDRLILSNGHTCPVRYAAMSLAGYFPEEELKTLRKINSRIQGHPHRTSLPGLETTSGPLGEGISQAIGIALAGRIDKKKYRVYCVASDGELQEGNSWEALMFAGKQKIDSLTLVIDRNNIQIDGFTEDVMPLEVLSDKFKAFNWHVIEVDGHNMQDIVSSVAQAQAIHEQPTVLIAHTIPGKGVDFMENRFEWHGNPPDIANVSGAPVKGEQAKKALEELRTLQGKIESEYQ